MVKIIGCNRGALIGDCIVSLVFPVYLEKRYPKSIKIAYLDKRCAGLIPLLQNHDYLDGIRVSDMPDAVSDKDENYFKKFDLVFEPFPTVTELDYFNRRSVIEETFIMSSLRGRGRINPKAWDILTEEERKPRLNCWFDVPKNDNYVAIWANSGYNNNTANQKRNPSKQYWAGLVDRLIKEGYKVAQLGIKDHELISDQILDLRHLSLFDAIRFSLGAKMSIQTDSGSSHLLGAYGSLQLILMTYWRNGHYQFPLSLAPVNCKDNAKILFHPTNINEIPYDSIIEFVKNC